MKTVAFIPVRGGSKSIPKKNIKELGGRPLLHWTLEAATRAEAIDAVYVSSDSDEILKCAEAFGHEKVKLLKRPPELASDTASTEDAMLHFAKAHEFEQIMLVQATSPLTTSADIDGSLEKMRKVGADSLLSVTHEHRFRWKATSDELVEAENYNPITRPRRQDWSGELMENGAFYVCARDALLESGCRLNGKVAHWTMPPHTAVEIDTPDDWEILEALVAKSRKPTSASKPTIKLLITDVDGVLTDAGMYYGPDGEAFKKFNTRDGMGIRFWQEDGRALAIVTGENSAPVARRAEKLKISDVNLGISNKLPLVKKLAAKYGAKMSEVAYIGDDLNDLESLREIGFAGCPADAHQEVRAIAHYVCKRNGGTGCVREFIEFLLADTQGS